MGLRIRCDIRDCETARALHDSSIFIQFFGETFSILRIGAVKQSARAVFVPTGAKGLNKWDLGLHFILHANFTCLKIRSYR